MELKYSISDEDDSSIDYLSKKNLNDLSESVLVTVNTEREEEEEVVIEARP